MDMQVYFVHTAIYNLYTLQRTICVHYDAQSTHVKVIREEEETCSMLTTKACNKMLGNLI